MCRNIKFYGAFFPRQGYNVRGRCLIHNNRGIFLARGTLLDLGSSPSTFRWQRVRYVHKGPSLENELEEFRLYKLNHGRCLHSMGICIHDLWLLWLYIYTLCAYWMWCTLFVIYVCTWWTPTHDLRSCCRYQRQVYLCVWWDDQCG